MSNQYVSPLSKEEAEVIGRAVMGLSIFSWRGLICSDKSERWKFVASPELYGECRWEREAIEGTLDYSFCDVDLWPDDPWPDLREDVTRTLLANIAAEGHEMLKSEEGWRFHSLNVTTKAYPSRAEAILDALIQVATPPRRGNKGKEARVTLIFANITDEELERYRDSSCEVQISRKDHYRAVWEESYRGGGLDSEYLCDERGKALLELAGKRVVYLGEVLGKHSDVATKMPYTFDPEWGHTLGGRYARWGIELKGGLCCLDALKGEFYAESDSFSWPDVVSYEAFLVWLKGD